MRSSSPPPQKAASTSRNSATTIGAVDFLRAHDTMAALLPALTRMIALQKECAKALPAMFAACSVLQFESGQLILSTPNTALTAKLKQQLPRLQEKLLNSGWQVNAIRLKVQVADGIEKLPPPKQLALSTTAVSAFAKLGEALDESPRNAALRTALRAMVQRHS